MRYELFIVIILLSCGQKKIETFTWESIEKPLDNQSKREVLLSVNDKLVKDYDVMSVEISSLEMYSLFHFIDVNQDGRDDIIFNGYGGAADEYIMIFLGSVNGYRKRLHCYGHIENVQLTEGTITVKEIEFVGDNSGDSLLTYNIQRDTIFKTNAVRIR